ncbi:MAG: ABC transporter substrate-binding protein [Candidatus Methylumidiphilus sp.]
MINKAFILLAMSFFSSSPSADGSPPVLRISAFKDISAFLLASLRQDEGFRLRVEYVQNADEAHDDLKRHKADIVFMSYDDTLSMAVQDGYRDIAAFMPVHGGLLDLCGALDLAAGKNRVGIDTDTGYARALRLCLRKRYPEPEDYRQLQWRKVGATNIRFEQLRDGQIDATLLNPPFSYQTGITRIAALTRNEVIPSYQGVVANLNRSWWARPAHRKAALAFVRAYRQALADMQSQPGQTIAKLATFYGLSQPVASAVYARLWEADGLNTSLGFDGRALAETERVFAEDTGLTVPKARAWVLCDPPGWPVMCGSHTPPRRGKSR